MRPFGYKLFAVIIADRPGFFRRSGPGRVAGDGSVGLPDCRRLVRRASDYASPVGDYGLPLHHPRFIEWIGVPQSAGLMELSGARWVDKLSRDQAVAAAVHLQRDVGLMQTNVDVAPEDCIQDD